MFDRETASLIQTALPIEGLDLERLPQDLTDAYSLVVSARIAVANGGEGTLPSEWPSTLLRLRRLAETYEGFTIFLPIEDSHRSACAFIAGSAHFTLNQARRLSVALPTNAVEPPSLTTHSVAPEVAATLLFLIGGHQADAAETAKTISSNGMGLAARQLLEFIRALASGAGEMLRRVVDSQLVVVSISDVDYIDAIADRLWSEIAFAVQHIARRAMGLNSDDPLAVIDAVLNRLVGANAEVRIGNATTTLRLPLAGPYHLAKLLRSAAEVLLSSTVANAIAPTGVDAAAWQSFVRHFASKRPFLWRNHVRALSEGFLNSGSSFILTFPTGAGKTTITELRIASELLRGRSVVYLAPTRALVDQVQSDVTECIAPISRDAARGRFTEDYGESVGAKVFIQTPEQCLAFISHDKQAHTDLGLIVMDEFHQLSGMPSQGDNPHPSPNRRAVDAMWALLSLLQRSPNADVVLISAMVRNGVELAKWMETVTHRPARLLDLAWKPTRQVRGVVAYESSDITKLDNELLRRRRAKGSGRKPGAADKRGIQATPIGLFCHTQVWNTASTFAKFPLLAAPVSLAVNQYWGLSANRNEVGGKLLDAMARAGMRPMVFSQRIDWTEKIAESAAGDLESGGVSEIALLKEEEDLFAAAGAELGGPHFVQQPSRLRVGVHHGLLLLSERLGMESAFRRPNGLWALVATPTVAQGINLPAEAVIIAGDDRWEAQGEDGGPETIAVHELLNAAGRAGRAGHYAHGLVIDLPGRVFTVSETSGSIEFSGLQHVMGLFGLPDQCLTIVDPLTQVIDRIAANAVHTDVSQYFVRRINGLDDATLRGILGAMFGNVANIGRDQAVETQALLLKAAGAGLNEAADTTDANGKTWSDLASNSGLSPLAVTAVASSHPPRESIASWSFPELLKFNLDLLCNGLGMLFGLVDSHSSALDRIIPRRSKLNGGVMEFTEEIAEWEMRWQAALTEVLPLWLGGIPLYNIGEALHRHRGAKGHVKAIQLGRRFALQTAGGISHGVSVIASVTGKLAETSSFIESKPWMSLLSACFREGFDDPDKLLLFWHLRQYQGLYPRVRVHKIYEQRIRGKVPVWEKGHEVDHRRRLIRDLIGNDPPSEE
jgi:hypothetical protein